MGLRSASLYVEPHTVKRLNLVRKLYPEKTQPPFPLSEGRDKTIDERADDMLNEMIEQKFPRVIGLEKALAQVEKTFIATGEWRVVTGEVA